MNKYWLFITATAAMVFIVIGIAGYQRYTQEPVRTSVELEQLLGHPAYSNSDAVACRAVETDSVGHGIYYCYLVSQPGPELEPVLVSWTDNIEAGDSVSYKNKTYVSSDYDSESFMQAVLNRFRESK